MKEVADRSWGQDGKPPAVQDAAPKSGKTKMLLVILKQPVSLPVSFIDAIQQGGIEKVSALEE
jgi:hypothetical protein